MRQVNGKRVCAQCGAELDVPKGRRPKVTIHGASGKPNVRVLMIDGKEIHRCEIVR